MDTNLCSLPPHVRALIRADIYAFSHLNWGLIEKQNLTIREKRAIKELQKNNKLVIKPADKGNAVVLMNKEDYLWEGKRQLEVKDHYKPLTAPIYTQTALEIRNILGEMCDKGVISGNKRIIYWDQERLDQDDFTFYQKSTRILVVGVRLSKSLQEDLLYLTVTVSPTTRQNS